VVRAFIDSVNIRASGEMPARVSARCGEAWSGWARHQKWGVPGFRWSMHQPTAAAIAAVVADVKAGKIEARPTRIDVAIDIPCRTVAEAEERAAFIAAHAVKFGGEQSRPASINDETWYIGQRTPRGMVIVVYGDKLSRFDRTAPVVHVEVRLCGKATLARAGIRNMEDVANLDPVRISALIAAAIKWRRVDWSKLARRFPRPRNKLGSTFVPRSREAIIERACQGEAQRAVRRFGKTWAQRRGWLKEVEPPHWWTDAITSNRSLFDVPAPPRVITCTTPHHPHPIPQHHRHNHNQVSKVVPVNEHPQQVIDRQVAKVGESIAAIERGSRNADIPDVQSVVGETDGWADGSDETERRSTFTDRDGRDLSTEHYGQTHQGGTGSTTGRGTRSAGGPVNR